MMSQRDRTFGEMLRDALERDRERTQKMLFGDNVDEAEAMAAARQRGNPFWRLFKRYYLGRHLWTVVATTILAATAGCFIYGYTLAGRIIADDVVQIGLMNQDTPPGADLDPTLTTESRLFQLDEPRARTSITHRHDERPGKSREEKLKLLGWVALALVLMESLRHLIHWIVFDRTVYLTQKVQFRLRQHVHDKLNNLPLNYHDHHSPGRLLTHLFSDMNVISSTMTAFLRIIPEALLGIFLGLAIVLYLDFKLGLLVLLALPAYTVVYCWFAKYQRALNKDVREREGKLNAHIANRVSHFQVVKAYGRETTEAVSFLRRVRPILRENIGIALFGTAFNILCTIISTTCLAAVLWMSAIKLRNGEMTPGELLMFYGSVAHLFAPVGNLANQATVLHRVTAVAAKVMRVLDEPVTLTDPDNPTEPPMKAPEVRVENVTHRYSPEEPAVLEDINFSIPAGKRLCVMGPSGSGKTTLAKLICRFYDPTEGGIYFDGVDIRTYKLSALREVVGFVSQEPIVFSGTISDNIRYGTQQADEREIIRSAQYAQIHEHIEQLPAKYRTLTQERGLTLSGGQKQRVNLARTLMQNNRFLVLDDCTSALDADTEARLIDALKTVLHERTALLVSHRVSVAMSCDLVLMLENGRVVEYGPPRELINADGAFAAVHNKQLEKAKQAEMDAVAAAGLRLAGAKS